MELFLAIETDYLNLNKNMPTNKEKGAKAR